MPISVVKPDATAIDVAVTDERLIVTLADGRELSVPLAWSARLSDATNEQRQNWRLMRLPTAIPCYSCRWHTS